MHNIYATTDQGSFLIAQVADADMAYSMTITLRGMLQGTGYGIESTLYVDELYTF